jgi:hypothetical protein
MDVLKEFIKNKNTIETIAINNEFGDFELKQGFKHLSIAFKESKD